MPRSEPVVRREGDLVLVRQSATTDRLALSPQGSRCVLATEDRAWLIDLDEARVVTGIRVPHGAREAALLDEDTLCVLDRDGTLRVHALPDGGCVASFEAPGAWGITGRTDRALVLLGAATIRVVDARFALETEGALLYAVDLRAGAITAVDGARFARALNAFPEERARLGQRVDLCSPWGALSPDGDEFALSFEVRSYDARPWTLGALDDRAWTHAYTFRLDDPDVALERWAAPLEGWTLAWRAPDTLTGYLSVATGAPPYRTMPLARRRIRRDGAVITWRPDDTDLLLAPGAMTTAVDLDDERFRACVASVGASHAITWDPTTDTTEVRDLLVGDARDEVHCERPVRVGLWSDGAWAQSVPLRDGGASISVDGVTRARIAPRLGPPQALDAAGPCVVLRWTPTDGAPWRTGYLRR